MCLYQKMVVFFVLGLGLGLGQVWSFPTQGSGTGDLTGAMVRTFLYYFVDLGFTQNEFLLIYLRNFVLIH